LSFDEDNGRLLNFRPLLAAAVGLIAGVAFCVSVNETQTAFYKACAILLPVLAAAFAVFGAVKGRRWMLVICAFFLVGMARVQLAAPDSLAGENVTVAGTVKSIAYTDTGASVALCRAACQGQGLRYGVLVIVKDGQGNAPDKLPFEAGDKVSIVCQSIGEPTQMYGVYNERLARLAEGISLKAKAEADDIAVVAKGSSPYYRLITKTKEAIGRKIDGLFGSSSALVSAFIIGEKDGVPEDVYADFLSGGIAHLLTISGFHVGVITALLYALLPKRYPRGRFAVIGLFLLCYCAVTGFAASLLRASLMCMCVLFADAVCRRADVLSSLSLAAVLILLVSPYKLYSAGFCLSFAATLGIVLAFSFGVPKFKTGIAKALLSTVTVTIGATAASMLLTARYFGTFYTYGIIVNVLFVPLFSAAMVMCFVLTFASFLLPNVCMMLAAVPNALLDAALRLLNKTASLPYARLTTVTPSILSCVLMLLLLFSASAYVLRPLKRRAIYTAIMLALFTASAFADIITV